MVIVGLQIKATLINVDKIYPYQPEQFSWPLKVKCTGCGDDSPHWHLISMDEVVELTNSQANFYYKCKCCSRENHLSILTEAPAKKGGKKDKKALCKAYTSEDEGEFCTLALFDCRGLELTAFDPRDGWAAESGKKIFTDVDLSDPEGWTEYNDIDNVPVEINSIQHQFVTVK